jgi:hypothetical protein
MRSTAVFLLAVLPMILSCSGPSEENRPEETEGTVANPVSFTVASITPIDEGRRLTIDIRIPEGISITKEAMFLVAIERSEPSAAPDKFGPPQSFALKGTSHEVTASHFRVSVVVPAKKVSVLFTLRGKNFTHTATRWI